MKVKKNQFSKKEKKRNSVKHYAFAHTCYLFVSVSSSKDQIRFEARAWGFVNVLPGHS